MRIENLFLEKLAELDKVVKTASMEPQLADVQFFQDRIEEIDVPLPMYQTQVVLAADENDSLEVLREKKQAKEPEDLVEKAHPKPVYLSEALGDGGLVENQNEQRAKIQQMINKMPTGNLVNTYAAVLNELVKIATDLEDESPEAAGFVDATIAEICGRAERLEKFALAFVPILIGTALLGAGTGIFQAFQGIQENLQIDAGDLVGSIDGWKNKPELAGVRPLADKLYHEATELAATAGPLMRASSSVAAGNKAAAASADQLSTKVSQLVEQINATMAQISSTAGMSIPDLAHTQGRIDDIESDLAALGHLGQQAAARAKSVFPGMDEVDSHDHSGAAAPAPAAPAKNSADRIGAIQAYLTSVGFAVAKTGAADEATKSALGDFERHINESDFSGEKEKLGLGLKNLPGNRLSEMLESTLTAQKLQSLMAIFQNPSAYVRI